MQIYASLANFLSRSLGSVSNPSPVVMFLLTIHFLLAPLSHDYICKTILILHFNLFPLGYHCVTVLPKTIWIRLSTFASSKEDIRQVWHTGKFMLHVISFSTELFKICSPFRCDSFVSVHIVP